MRHNLLISVFSLNKILTHLLRKCSPYLHCQINHLCHIVVLSPHVASWRCAPLRIPPGGLFGHQKPSNLSKLTMMGALRPICPYRPPGDAPGCICPILLPEDNPVPIYPNRPPGGAPGPIYPNLPPGPICPNRPPGGAPGPIYPNPPPGGTLGPICPILPSRGTLKQV